MLRLPALLQRPPYEEIRPLIGVAGVDLSTDGGALSALNSLCQLGRVQLAGLCEPAKDRREAAGDFLGLPAEQRFSELEGLLSGEPPGRGKRLDAVLVLGPLASRPDAIRRALEKKVHVLSEAPLARTSPEAQALIDAAAAGGVHLGVLHSRRYEAVHSEALWAVRQRHLGEIRLVRIERAARRSEPLLEDPLEGLYADAYLARAWADSPVTAVFARMESRRSRKDAVSLALLHLQHAGGASSVVLQTESVGPCLEVCEIHGVEGSIRLDRQGDGWSLCRSREGPAHLEQKTAGPETLRGGMTLDALAPEPGVRPYGRALDDAFASFARGLPPPVDGREGWLNLRLLDAARESARTGQAVRVDIPFPR